MKYVFIDIDGTLYDHKNKCVPNSAKQAIKQAHENGHKLFICTGRSKPIVEKRYSHFDITGMIYAGGAHIEINHEIQNRGYFSDEMIDQFIQYFRANDVAYTLEGIETTYYSEKSYAFVENYFCKDKEKDDEMVKIFHESSGVKFAKDFKREDGKQIVKIEFFAKNDESIQMFIQQLPKGTIGFLDHAPIGDYIHGEIQLEGKDKAGSIDTILNLYQDKIENTIAIGDSANDMTMITHAHLGIAMGNASQALKEKANYVTSCVDEDGLYNAFVYAGLI